MLDAGIAYLTTLFETVLTRDPSATLTKDWHSGEWEVGLYHDHMGPTHTVSGPTIAAALSAAQGWVQRYPTHTASLLAEED